MAADASPLCCLLRRTRARLMRGCRVILFLIRFLSDGHGGQAYGPCIGSLAWAHNDAMLTRARVPIIYLRPGCRVVRAAGAHGAEYHVAGNGCLAAIGFYKFYRG